MGGSLHLAPLSVLTPERVVSGSHNEHCALLSLQELFQGTGNECWQQRAAEVDHDILSDRMVKWQVKLRAERSNLACIEKNYPDYMYAAVGLLLVVVQEGCFFLYMGITL